MQRWKFTPLILLLTVFLLWDNSSHEAQQAIPTTIAQQASQGAIRASRLGITFINAMGFSHSDDRYRNALTLGAGWNRWPLYWHLVEQSPNNFNWGAYDALVAADLRSGLQTNAILLERPPFYVDGDGIRGLNEPVFADGSDNPAPNKAINPNNPWAVFVFQAVNRYKPGGAAGLGGGIRVWEVWNEPDLPQFWQGGIVTYARLLKVAYLAAHQADAQAQVMVGGLLYNTPTNWLDRILAIYANDPLHSQANWFMDAVAIHSYNYPWRTGHLTKVTRQTLSAYGLQRPIFVNETGLNVWDDYPGPVWSSSGQESFKRGSMNQQAWFLVQSTVYAWSEGAQVVFFHQLYDDCGDQGGNFPPHNGELCHSGSQCYGDAFGLFRNLRDSACYSQHASPGSPRPGAAAFRMLAQVFGAAPFVTDSVIRRDGLTMINFRRSSTNEIIRVIWNRRLESNTASIPAAGTGAALYTLQGNSTLSPQNGAYQLTLGAAQASNFPSSELDNNDLSAIGGEPVILVELALGDFDITQLQGGVSEITSAVPPSQGNRVTPIPSSEQLLPTPGSVLIVPSAPTTEPSLDTSPPVSFVEALAPVSPATFTVRWGAEDNGLVERYVVWVQVNDSTWSPWLETQRNEGIYTGLAGNTYRFAVWAVDSAGNWSTNTNLVAQAETRVE